MLFFGDDHGGEAVVDRRDTYWASGGSAVTNSLLLSAVCWVVVAVFANRNAPALGGILNQQGVGNSTVYVTGVLEQSCPLKEDACVRGYTLSLLLAIQTDICLAGLLPKGDTLPPGKCSRRPVATLLWCKSRQSKRPSSIHFVQSRKCDNLLSSL